MKVITKNLRLFAILIFLHTSLFRFGLSSLLDAEKYSAVIAISIIYSLLMGLTGWLTGRRDGKDSFLFDAGFRWHFTTYLVWAVVSEAWFLLGFNAAGEKIAQVHTTLLIWGCLLLIHLIIFLILRKKTIKGVHKADIFE